MSKNQKSHQAASAKAGAAGMLRGNVSRFYATGVNKNAVRAASADDEIAEARAEIEERKVEK